MKLKILASPQQNVLLQAAQARAYRQLCNTLNKGQSLPSDIRASIQGFLKTLCLDNTLDGMEEKQGFNTFITKKLGPSSTINGSLSDIAIHSEFLSHVRVVETLCLVHSLDTTKPLSKPSQFRQILDVYSDVQKLFSVNIIEPEELNTLSLALFGRPLPENLKTSETLDNDIDHLKASLSTYWSGLVKDAFTSVLTDILSGSTLNFIDKMNALPVCLPHLSDDTCKILSVLHNALFPDAPLSLSLESRYLNVALTLSRVAVSPHVLDVFAPKGVSGTPLDEILGSVSGDIQNAIKPILDNIRLKRSATSGIEHQRWHFAEQRIGEIVHFLAEHQSLIPNQIKIITDILNKQQADWANACSVGIDLKAIDLKYAILDVFSQNKHLVTDLDQEKLHTQLLPSIQFRLQEILRGILNDHLASDVHHVNYLMLYIHSENGENIPSWLYDSYVPAYKDLMDQCKPQLVRKFNDPLWLVEAFGALLQDKGVVDTTLSDAQTQLGTMIRPIAADVSLSFEQRLSVFVSVMEILPEYFLNEIAFHSERMRQLHFQLGGHGLLGLAAKSGAIEVFLAVQCLPELSSIPSHQRDHFGYTLLDYAVWGGHTAIFEQIFSNLHPDNLAEALNQSTQTPRTPNIIALAAESQNPNMIKALSTCLTPEQIRTMLFDTDNRGYTPLMHAAVTGKETVLQALFDLDPEAFNSSDFLNAYNNDWQNALVLAVSYAKSPEAVRWLLDKGADPNSRVLRTGEPLLVLAILDRNIDILVELLSYPSIEKLDPYSRLGRELATIFYNLSNEDVISRLSVNNTRYRIALAHTLADYARNRLFSVLENLQNEAVMDILCLKSQDGNTVAHRLISTSTSKCLSEVLLKLDYEDIVKILCLKNQFDDDTVAHGMAFLLGQSFLSVLAKLQIQDMVGVLSMQSELYGTVAHGLSNQHAFCLIDFLAQYPDIAFQIWSLKNTRGRFVWEFTGYDLRNLSSDPARMGALHLQMGGHGIVGLAAKSGMLEEFLSVQKLFETSCIPSHQRDRFGYTLLDYAVWGGHTAIFNQIFSTLHPHNLAEALNQSTQTPRTPNIVGLAAKSKNPEMVKAMTCLTREQIQMMLIDADSRGYTPLLLAAVTGKETVLQAVFDLDPEFFNASRDLINAYNNDGQNALFLAVSNDNSVGAVRCLLNKGADPNSNNVLQRAILYRNIDSIIELLSHPGLTKIDNNSSEGYALTEIFFKLSDEYVRGYLLVNNTRNRIAFALGLANFLPERLLDFLNGLDNKAIVEILSLKNELGNTVAHEFTRHPKLLIDFLVQRQDIALQILSLQNLQGRTVGSLWKEKVQSHDR